MESPAATTTTGIYCKTCGYDLRGSLEGGRCPECGRVFSPDDPESFRKRPFAAPWKRALGRWAKRTAILLLALGILLGGTWGWLYWGWKQEQAALAQVRGEVSFRDWDSRGRDPLVLGGAAGQWLYDRHVPGSFVLVRARGVRLQGDATDADLLPLRHLPELYWLHARGPIGDAGLAALRPCRQMRHLWLEPGSGITDAGLAALRDLPRLEVLCLSEARITGPGLAVLDKLPQLNNLILGQTPLTDAGLAHVAPHGRLVALQIAGTQITDAGLVHVAKLNSLAILVLNDTRVTDAGLAYIAKLKALQILLLRDTRVTDAGLVHLAGLPLLCDLCLDDTAVTDAGLAHLEKLPALCSLALRNTRVSDAGLVHLEKYPALSWLALHGTQVTPAGVARFKAARPGCEILGP